MDLLEKAEMIARWAHRDQFDREGMPYWTHCMRVAHNLRAAGYDEEIQAVGWLHDVVEDTSLGIEDIWELLDGNQVPAARRVFRGVEAMTQLPGEALEPYWARVKGNEYARVCKLFGDIPDNDDEGRRRRVMKPAWGEKQRQKYLRARAFLMTDAERQFWCEQHGVVFLPKAA